MNFDTIAEVIVQLSKADICLYDTDIMVKVIMISDRDQNGSFNFEEFLRIVTALKVAKDLQDQYKDQPSIKSHIASYVASDRNYDGRVSVNELCDAYARVQSVVKKSDLAKVLKNMNVDQMNIQEYSAVCSTLDTRDLLYL